jgi:anti-repressor protein
MNQLITTFQENDQILVNGRELHEFLDVNTQYTKWFERMSDYGFVENQDYKAISQKRLTAQGNNTTYIDHHLTLDMAKEISMLQRNDKGKQARQYFLDLERKWNSPEMVLKRAQDYLNEQVRLLTEENNVLKPKALFAEAVETSKSSVLVGELSKVLKQNGVNVGQNRLFEWLRENGYLIKRKGDSYNLPTQYAMELELFEIKKRTVNNPDGSIRTTRTPKVTGKGQVYFVNKFLSEQ